MRPAHIYFDFDGTIADSFQHAVQILEKLAVEFKLRPIVDAQAARAMPTRQFLKQLGVPFWRLPRLIRAFQAEAALIAHQLPIFPDLIPVLHELHRRERTLGILSSNSAETISRCLKQHDLQHLFSHLEGTSRLFGKAKSLRRILKDQQLDRKELIYVGDEVRDIEAARKVGVYSVAVTWGFHAENLLQEASPSQIIYQPEELLAL